MEFQLTDEVKRLGVSRVFTTDSSIHVYNGKAFAQSPYYKKELQKTLDKLKSQMLFCGHFGDRTTVDKIILLLSEIWVKSEEQKAQAQTQAQSSKDKREFLVYKYSNRKKDDLHEAIILAGKAVFLKYNSSNEAAEPITVIESMEEDSRTIKPPHMENYPYAPYEFESISEILSYVERARNETIDSLYLKAKQIATDYNDQKKEKVILLAIEVISSYFQDNFPTIHYDIVLGGNGSGKSTYGDTFTAVGYRVVNLTDPNAANINRILGCIEVGQCTIVSDETGEIDKHPDLLSILKTGYSIRGKTSKVNDFTRKPEFFSSYCFKMIISERMPNLRDAKGVTDRSFSFTTYKGLPMYDIKETLEPQGNPVRQERLDILNDFRKLMLVYRLVHYKDTIDDVDIGLEGREKELSKPIIQLFYKATAQREVEETLQYFLNLRNEKKETTLEPILHPIVADLVSKQGNELYVKWIWDVIKQNIEGYSDEKKPNEYHTLEYGTIYNNSIGSILEHTFGGRRKRREHGNTFIFDPEELVRVGRAYNVPTKIQTKITDIEESNRSISEGSEGNEGNVEKSINEDKCNNKPNSRGIEESNRSISEGSEGNEGNTEEPPNYEKNNEDNGSPSIERPTRTDPSNKVIEECSYWSALNGATQKMVFWSRLTELVHKNGGSFTGNELQQRLISTSAYTNVVFLIKEALENREIEAIEGQFDTYRLIGAT